MYKINLLHTVILCNPDFQMVLGLTEVLPGFLEALLHVRNFRLELLAALGSIHLQKEVVSRLQGFLSGRKRNDRVADLIVPQFVPADLIVQNRHIESISGELLEGHPGHPTPAGDGASDNCQAAQSSNFITCFHFSLSADVLNLPARLLL